MRFLRSGNEPGDSELPTTTKVRGWSLIQMSHFPWMTDAQSTRQPLVIFWLPQLAKLALKSTGKSTNFEKTKTISGWIHPVWETLQSIGVDTDSEASMVQSTAIDLHRNIQSNHMQASLDRGPAVRAWALEFKTILTSNISYKYRPGNKHRANTITSKSNFTVETGSP